MNIVEALGRSRCFKGLERNQLRDFIQSMELRPFQRNQSIIHEGDRRARLAFVATGRVKLVRHRASGKDLIVDILGPGQLVDSALSDDDSESSDIVGLAQGAIATIDRKEFLLQLHRHGQMAINLALELVRDKETLMVRFDEISAGSVEARLAAVLFRLASYEGEECDEGIKLTLPLSRQDLADLVDTTIETAIRIMSRWNRDEIVLTRRDGFLIPDLDALEDLTD